MAVRPGSGALNQMPLRAGSETSDPLVGTAKVYFDEGNKRYDVKTVGSRLLVICQASDQKVGMIYIPDTAVRQESVGFILDAGEGEKLPDGTRAEPRFQVGDMVVFGNYSGAEINLSGQSFRVLEEDSVLCVLSYSGEASEDEEEE